MNTRYGWLVGAAMVFVVAGGAHAQVPVSSGHSMTRLEITPFLGYRWGGDVEGWDISFAGNRLDGEVESGAGFGLALDVPLGADYQIQLLYDTQSSEITTGRNLINGSSTASDVSVGYTHVGLSRSWFHSDQVAFFLACSAGLTSVEVDAPGLADQSRPSIGVGGGLKYFAARHWAVRLELRQYWTRMDDQEEYHIGEYVFFFPSDMMQTGINIGVSYVW